MRCHVTHWIWYRECFTRHHSMGAVRSPPDFLGPMDVLHSTGATFMFPVVATQGLGPPNAPLFDKVSRPAVYNGEKCMGLLSVHLLD
eukprot:CAMPEP_0174380892 /NCGR_PEP_ID=MMETSP0811_2-20130205/123659_1 /TAXON_ID=73025 ORGANISM="Eutreptiella gymnastica-like, Strain CCMP1594" /NCGR_SAMPLE_ID=MMETSP0811_2 /ASSEMBLY_ACC=CAM_ASM_000667 /LENGTH=86 /DNA_ID=CAMNT_0015533873 /DNA_START=128 /DNA_END=388 /DNA_ORIENTATION=+